MAIQAPEQSTGGEQDAHQEQLKAAQEVTATPERVTPAEMVKRQLEIYDEHTHQRQVMDPDQMVEAARKRVQESGGNFDELLVDEGFDAMRAEKEISVAQHDTDVMIGDVKHMVARPESEFQRSFNEEYKAQLRQARGQDEPTPAAESQPPEPRLPPFRTPAPMLGTTKEPRYLAVDEDKEPTAPIPIVKPKLRHRVAQRVKRVFRRGAKA